MPLRDAAIDRQRAFALYVSDTGNNRVLYIWKDSVRFRSGIRADLALDNEAVFINAPNVDSSNSQSPGATFVVRTGDWHNPTDGTSWVIIAVNRVLRYPRPVSQSGRIKIDAVIGQVDFMSSTI